MAPLSPRRTNVPIALLFGLAACGPSIAPAAERSAPDGPPILVRNLAWCDVRIYAIRGGFTHRLGMVTSMNRRTFVLPPDLVDGDRIELLVNPLGRSDSFLTGPILVAENQELHLTVQEPIRLSTFATRARN